MNIGQIAEATLMEQPTVSRAVAQLEAKGKLTRRASGEDARITQVSLTSKGVEAFEQIMPTALRHQSQALNGFSQADVAQLTDLLARIERNIDAYD
jgi:DNA-binding MarR family transcriptional regulator